MNNKIANIFLYFIIGLIAVRYGFPLIIKGVVLLIKLIGGVIGLAFGTIGLLIGLIFTVVPLIIIGWVIYTFLLKKNPNSN
ncbi:MAG: hypothetical protein GXW85_03100 [Clostridia bacterium]|nr:hypothetical protein [Clostridia bacterium]